MANTIASRKSPLFATWGLRLGYLLAALCVAFSGGLSAAALSSATPVTVKVNAGGGATGDWSADQLFTGGRTDASTATVDLSKVTNPAPMSVYQTERWGDFSYTLSGLQPNTDQTVRLHFNEFYVSAVGQRVFSVQANGVNILTDFDIFRAAGGKNIAIARDFVLRSTASGSIVLRFTNAKADDPKVSGIELIGSGSVPVTSNVPTNLTASNASATGVTLAWSAPSTPSGPVQGYHVYQGSTRLTTTPITATMYSVTGLSPSTTYSFTVKSVVGGVESAPSAAASVTTLAAVPTSNKPTGLSADTVSATGVTLSWKAPAQPSGPVQGYHVYQGTTRLTSSPVTATSFAVSGLSPSTTYSFSVKAVVAGTESEASDALQVITAATPPSGNTALSRINSGGAGVGDWLADTKYSGGVADRSTAAVDVSKVTNPAPQSVYQSERWGDFSYTFSGLQPNVDHTVRLHFNEFYLSAVGQRVFSVQANGANILTDFDIIRAAGGKNIAIARDFVIRSTASGSIVVRFTNAKADDPKVSGIELIGSGSAPVTSNVPTNLTASNVTTTGVTLSWAAPVTPSGPVQGYHVYQNSAKITSAPVTATSFAVSGLSPSTTYAFSVKAVVAGVESGASEALQVITAGTPPTGATVLSRVNGGGAGVGDWLADTKYSGGTADRSTAAVDLSKVTNPAPQAVYQSERWGDFTYTFAGLQPNADHTVRLHFNEIYWVSPGQRVFDVTANGRTLLASFDIVREAGRANVAIAREFTVKSDAGGTIRLAFVTKTDAAKVSGIELIGPAPVTPPPGGVIFPTGQNMKIMAIGDSITYGQPSDSTGGFRMPLWDKMAAIGWAFTPVGWQNGPPFPPYPTNSPYNGSGHSAAGGWTMNDFFNEGSLNWTGETVHTWTLRYTPDVMMLHIGTNDISKGDDQATLRSDFVRLLDTLIADRPSAHIFVAQIINYSTYMSPYVSEYNAMIANVVNERRTQGKRVYLVNMEAALANNASYYSDYVHPNTAGYLQMAETWLSAFLAANSAAVATVP